MRFLSLLKSVVIWLVVFAAARLICSAVPLGNYQSHSIVSNPAGLRIRDTSGNYLRLRAYGDNMIRVQAQTSSSFFPDDRYLMIENHNLGGALSILSDTASSLVISNGAIRLTVSKNPLRLAFADAAGNPLLSDATGIGLDPTTLRYVFAPDASEKFIGYGQKRLALQDTFELAGRTERRNYGEEGFPGRGSQGVLIVPFFISSKGYGFFANTTFPHEGRFNVAGDYSFRVEANGLPTEADYFFIYGPKPADILDHYTELTGRPRLPRKAIFGLHLSDHDPNPPGVTSVDENWWKATVTNHFAAGFPLDHMVYDNSWRAPATVTNSCGGWSGSQFDFCPARYPSPATFRQWYDSKGLTLTLDLNLNICNDSYGWQTNYNLKPSDTVENSQPDYSNPATRAWLWDLFWTKALNPVLGYPGDAIWLDESDGIWQPDNYLIANGRPWREMKNYYFFLTAYAAVAEGWDNAEGGVTPGIGEAKRPWVWIRGGGPGMQRYASHWTGDIEFSTNFYKGQIIGMQASGLAGFPFFNHDAGGFGSTSQTPAPDPDPTSTQVGPNDNYYIQWGCGFGSFSPIWRPHGYGSPRWPLNRSPECQDAFRRYAALRYELMPYIYTLAHEAHDRGLPMARPMPLVYPNSPEAWQQEQEYQYHWGDSLLIAPAFHLNGTDEPRTVWLPPAADWYDFWTEIPVGIGPAGGFHTFTARFGYVPVFVKAGAIIPRQNFALSTAFLSDTNLTLDVYKGAAGDYTLIEDDGVTERFRTRNEIRTTVFNYTEPAGQPTFYIAPAVGSYTNASATRSYIVRLHGLTCAPLQVTVDGAPVSMQAAPLPGGVTNAAAWDTTRRHLLVRVSPRPVGASATVSVLPGTTIDPVTVVPRPVYGFRWERWNYAGDLRANWPAQKATILAAPPTSFGEAAASSVVPSTVTSGDNFVVRLSGSILAPTNGNYRFWIYADDRGQFYFQKNLALTNLSLIASNSQSQTPNQWDEEAIQQSAPVTLQAGQAYKFEFILAEFTGNAHGGFGWTLPDGTLERPLPANYFQLASGPSFAHWIAQQSIGATNTLDDPDGDGLVNLLEAGLGTFPKTPNAEPPLMKFTGNLPLLSLPSPWVDDITMELQSSTNLAGDFWQPLVRWTATNHWQSVGDLSGIVLDPFVQRCADARANERAFYRFQVSQP